MKKITNLFLLLVTVLLSSTVIIAQDYSISEKEQQMIDDQAKELIEKQNLTNSAPIAHAGGRTVNVIPPDPITAFPYTEDFESGSFPSTMVPNPGSESDLTLTSYAANNSNYGAMYEGGSNWGNNTPTNVTAAFAYTDHVAKLEMEVVPTGQPGQLIMEFDLTQRYSFNPNYEWFRVLVNGTPIADINGNFYHQPTTPISDPWQRLVYDLSSYQSLGSFTLTIENSAKYWYQYYRDGDLACVDNFLLYYELFSDPPTSLSGVATYPTIIELDWTQNAGSDDVMLVYSENNTFGTPLNSVSYIAGDVLPGGGTVLYVGSDLTFDHIDLTPMQTYYYNAYSVDADVVYSLPVSTSAYTDIPVIGINPTTLDFGDVAVGYPETATVTFENTGATILTVDLSVNNTDYTLDVSTLDVAPLATGDVEVTFDPAVAGPSNGYITVHSNDPNNPYIYVSLMGEGYIPPVLSVNPLTLDEALTTGASSSQILTLSNTGSGDADFVITKHNAGSGKFPSTIELKKQIQQRANIMRMQQGKVSPENRKPLQTTRGVVSMNNIINPGATICIIDPDNDPASGEEIYTLLTNDNNVCDYVTEFTTITDYSQYNAVFITLGIFGYGAYILQPVDVTYLVPYLDNGGNIYMEGGDTWYYDPIWEVNTPLHAYFGINPIEDGSSDLSNVNGLSGVFTEGLSYAYSGANNWIDRIEAGDPTAFNILENPDVSYICGVANETGLYNTIGSSFVLGGLDDNGSNTRLELLNRMLEFFNPTIAPWLTINPQSGTIGTGKANADISIGFNAAYLAADTYTADIRISSNDPENPTLVVPVELVVTDGGNIVASPDPMDFGSVIMGYDDDMTLVVTNNGNQTILVDEVLTDNSDYTVSLPLTLPDAIVVSPEDGQADDDITIIFDPTENPCPSVQTIDWALNYDVRMEASITVLGEDDAIDTVYWDATGDVTLMTRNDDETYSITINPNDYFGVTSTDIILGINCVFNSGYQYTDPWEYVGKDYTTTCSHFYIPITTTAFPLTAGASQNIVVNFAPSVTTTSNGILTIYNDGNEGDVDVVLIGEGDFPPEMVVSPTQFDVTMNAGEIETSVLTINNNGDGVLTFDIEKELAVGKSRRTKNYGAYADETRVGDNTELPTGITNPDVLPNNNRGVTGINDMGDIINTYSSSFQNCTGMTWAGDELFGVNYNGDLYKYDFVAEQAIWVANIHSSPFGITWDGQYLWIGNASGNVYAYNLDGTSAVFSFSCPFSNYPAITYNGEHFLVSQAWVTNSIVYEIDETGTEVTQYPSNIGYSISEMVWADGNPDGNIWFTDQSGHIGLVDISSGTCELSTYFDWPYFTGSDYAIAYKGSDIWWSSWSGPIYQLDDGWSDPVPWLSIDPTSGTVQPGKTASMEIDLEVDATDLIDGQYAANVLINSNDPLNLQVVVPFNLTIIGTPTIILTPGVLDFGDCYTTSGYFLEQNLNIANTGSNDLEITSIDIDLPEYVIQLATYPLTLAPGEEIDLMVTFTPSAVSAFNGNLTIYNNYNASGDTVVPLLGNGVNPPIITTDSDTIKATVYSGETATEQFQISNTGGTNLEYGFVDTTNSLSLTGYDDYMYVPESSSINLTENFTIEAWINPTSYGEASTYGFGRVFDKQSVLIYFNDRDNPNFPDSSLVFTIYIGGAGFSAATPLHSIVLNKWQHISCQYDGSEMTIYINGIEQNLNYPFGYPSGTVDANTYLYIGESSAMDRSFYGSLDGIRIWDEIRTLEEVQSNIYNELSGSETGLMAYWNFNDGTANDLTSYNNTGSLQYGATIFNDYPTWLSLDPSSGTVANSKLATLGVTATFDGTNLSGVYDHTMALASTDPATPVMQVPVRLTVIDAPNISFNPETVDFGDVFIGFPEDNVIAVTNTGSDVLSITNIVSDNADFTVDITSFTVNPGNTFNVTATFAPVAMGSSSGNLRFWGMAAGQAYIDLPIQGVGVVPPVLVADPTSVTEELDSGETSEQTLTLSNSGNQDAINLDYNAFIDFNPWPTVANTWHYNLPNDMRGITWVDDELYVIDYNGELYTYDTETDALTPNSQIGVSNNYVWGLVYDGNNLWVGSYGSYLAIMEEFTLNGTATGNIIELSFNNPFMVSFDGTNFIVSNFYSSSNREIYKIDATGEILSTYIADFNHMYIFSATWGDNSLWVSLGSPDEGVGRVFLNDITGEANLISKFSNPWYNFQSYGLAYKDDHIWMSYYSSYIFDLDPYANAWLSINPVSGTIAEGDDDDITLSFNAQNLAGVYNANIKVFSNDPGANQTDVPVTLTVNNEPHMVLNPESLSFGEVFLGYSESMDLDISNDGSRDLTIYGMISYNSDFIVVNQPYTIPPGNNEVINVEFEPSTSGDISGVMEINSNDPDDPVDVPLDGTGIGQPVIDVTPVELLVMVSSGNTSLQALTIENTGAADLVYTIAVNPVVDWLIVDPVAGTLPTGTVVIDVTFDASTYFAGVYTTDLIVSSNDPLTPQVTVPVEMTVTEDVQTVPFTQGWNILSLNKEPANFDLLAILNDLVVNDQLEKVMDEAGNAIVYVPGFGWANNIGDMANTEGYYIKVTENTNLDVQGLNVVTPLDIPLLEGWNIMGYPCQNSQDAMAAVQPLIDDGLLVKVMDEAGGIIVYVDGVGWLNTITNFNPGEGYYIKVSGDATITLNEGPSMMVSQGDRNLPAEYFDVINDGKVFRPMAVVVTNAVINNKPIEVGDEIAVFDGDLCLGATKYGGSLPISIVVSADDPTTDAVDGFEEGSDFSIQVYDASSTGVGEANVDLNPNYATSLISLETAVATITVDALGIGDNNLTDNYLKDNYPNPFTASTIIEFGLTEKMSASLQIFDAKGMLVKTLVDNTLEPGIYKYKWQRNNNAGQDVRQGVYFYRLTSSKFTSTKSMIITK